MKVLVTDPIHKDGIEILKEISTVDISTDMDHEELIEKVPDYNAMVVRSATKVRKDVLDAAKKLKLIVRAGVGLDNIDLKYAAKKGIKVENTPEAPSNAAAELTLGLIISWARKLPQADKSLKNGEWAKSELLGKELQGKTLGIIGTGRIGTRAAKKASAFGMNLLGYDPEKNENFKEIGGKYVDFDEVLEESDYVSLHVPLNESTRHLIGEEELEIMNENSVLINTARGAVVDEEALIEALEKDKISGACLDVYENDPIEDGRLLKMSNVLLAPHIGANTEEAQRAAGVMSAKKIKEILA